MENNIGEQPSTPSEPYYDPVFGGEITDKMEVITYPLSKSKNQKKGDFRIEEKDPGQEKNDELAFASNLNSAIKLGEGKIIRDLKKSIFINHLSPEEIAEIFKGFEEEGDEVMIFRELKPEPGVEPKEKILGLETVLFNFNKVIADRRFRMSKAS
ncbi:MAG: hypothetical protein WCT37_03250 [Patescibacteria group bacterium]|jgi:hypothetical protein